MREGVLMQGVSRSIIAVALCAGAGTIHAQASEPSAAVVVAGYVRANSELRSLGDSEVVLDRRVADVAGKLVTDRARSEASAILRALGASRVGTKEQEMICSSESARDCRLRPKVRGIVALSAPRVEGDRASVDVHIWWESGSANEPVATKQMIVDLERVDGAWQVRGSRPLRIS